MEYEAIIIGGGFYGSAIAVYLAKERGFKKILIIEQERDILSRASYNNQARIHNGYHYSRSFTTAYRSRINFPRFIDKWPNSIEKKFTCLYAIARNNSKVTAKQFIRFCREIGAELSPAKLPLRSLFNLNLIEDIFEVKEYVFDATKLRDWAHQELNENGISILLNSKATSILKEVNSKLSVTVATNNRPDEKISSKLIFNCTYSGLNQFKGDFTGTHSKLKHEIAEMTLMKMPPELDNLGITVMDGPFFSVMPFPARTLHTLSHVRYTPHMHWQDSNGIDPYNKLIQYDRSTRVDRMIRDAARYVPSISQSKYIDSLFEVKTVLTKSEGDDGRPILFEKYLDMPGYYSILGGKIDNIFDILEKLDDEQFDSY